MVQHSEGGGTGASLGHSVVTERQRLPRTGRGAVDPVTSDQSEVAPARMPGTNTLSSGLSPDLAHVFLAQAERERAARGNQPAPDQQLAAVRQRVRPKRRI
jgi:hypothetical protein